MLTKEHSQLRDTVAGKKSGTGSSSSSGDDNSGSLIISLPVEPEEEGGGEGEEGEDEFAYFKVPPETFKEKAKRFFKWQYKYDPRVFSIPHIEDMTIGGPSDITSTPATATATATSNKVTTTNSSRIKSSGYKPLTDNNGKEKEEEEEEDVDDEYSSEKLYSVAGSNNSSMNSLYSVNTSYARDMVYFDEMESHQTFPENVIRNQKYNILTFLPLTLFDQFKYFSNMYFLLTALTQFVPILKVGYLFTYIAPLAFVLALSLGKEAYDDIQRMLQDRKANSEKFHRLLPSGDLAEVAASNIKVGDLIVVNMNCRIPADMVLLKTTDKSGASFIRTDQLDGETDWKLRRPLSHTQGLTREELAIYRARVFAEAPGKDIYSFAGKLIPKDTRTREVEPISVENMLWTNTVVATGQVVGAVVYTGRETRSALNRSSPHSKRGKTEDEINFLTKVLFIVLLVLSILMVAAQGFSGLWYVYLVRFMILFSSIIPISMRVNLDMAKLLYALMIHMDEKIPGTVVRNSTLPEELGRINVLLSDKTGTLTQNDMTFKKLHYGSGSFRSEDAESVANTLTFAATNAGASSSSSSSKVATTVKGKKTAAGKISLCVHALALCHNVTPVTDSETGENTYQASSPDEIALVKFTEKVGLRLFQRDLHSITLKNADDTTEDYEVLKIFPFSSVTKRMGIIVREPDGKISFYMKGADVVMLRIVSQEGSDW